MSCYRSFLLHTNAEATFTTAGTNVVNTWGTIGNQHFLAIVNQLSTFNIQGFKNVDIFGVEIVGIVRTFEAATGKCVLTDWSFEIEVNGNPSLISGEKVVSPDYYNIITTAPEVNKISLGRYINKISFADPIKSVKDIKLTKLTATGNNAETVGTISLSFDLTFNFLYQYEGEY